MSFCLILLDCWEGGREECHGKIIERWPLLINIVDIKNAKRRSITELVAPPLLVARVHGSNLGFDKK
jgi:hypothetical protein